MLIDIIKQRQSCRSYRPEGVPRELIFACLEAARLSPSACNAQPWHFIVVDELPLKNDLCEAVFQGPYAMNRFAKEAPVVIAVITEASTFMARIGGFLRGTRYGLIDLGIAVEHFALQATELGLATCWIGWFHENKVKKILRIPAHKKIGCLVCLGYPREEAREKNRKQPADIISFNSYQS